MERTMAGLRFRGSITSEPTDEGQAEPRFQVEVFAEDSTQPVGTFGPYDNEDDARPATAQWVWEAALRVFAPAQLVEESGKSAASSAADSGAKSRGRRGLRRRRGKTSRAASEAASEAGGLSEHVGLGAVDEHDDDGNASMTSMAVSTVAMSVAASLPATAMTRAVLHGMPYIARGARSGDAMAHSRRRVSGPEWFGLTCWTVQRMCAAPQQASAPSSPRPTSPSGETPEAGTDDAAAARLSALHQFPALPVTHAVAAKQAQRLAQERAERSRSLLESEVRNAMAGGKARPLDDAASLPREAGAESAIPHSPDPGIRDLDDMLSGAPTPGPSASKPPVWMATPPRPSPAGGGTCRSSPGHSLAGMSELGSQDPSPHGTSLFGPSPGGHPPRPEAPSVVAGSATSKVGRMAALAAFQNAALALSAPSRAAAHVVAPLPSKRAPASGGPGVLSLADSPQARMSRAAAARAEMAGLIDRTQALQRAIVSGDFSEVDAMAPAAPAQSWSWARRASMDDLAAAMPSSASAMWGEAGAGGGSGAIAAALEAAERDGAAADPQTSLASLPSDVGGSRAQRVGVAAMAAGRRGRTGSVTGRPPPPAGPAASRRMSDVGAVGALARSLAADSMNASAVTRSAVAEAEKIVSAAVPLPDSGGSSDSASSAALERTTSKGAERQSRRQLARSLAQAKSAQQDTAAELAAVRSLLADTEAQLAQARARSHQLREGADQARAAASKAVNQSDDDRLAAEKALEEVERLRADLEASGATSQSLRNDLAAAREEAEANAVALEAARGALAAAQEVERGAAERIASQEAQFQAAAKGSAKQARQELEDALRAHRDANSVIAGLRSEVAALKAATAVAEADARRSRRDAEVAVAEAEVTTKRAASRHESMVERATAVLASKARSTSLASGFLALRQNASARRTARSALKRLERRTTREALRAGIDRLKVHADVSRRVAQLERQATVQQERAQAEFDIAIEEQKESASEREREARAAFEAAQEEARAGFAAREAELEAARRALEAESADRAAREEERRRRLLGRYMQQMRQGSQASAFRAWRDHTSTRKSARRTLARLIGRRTHSELGRAMTSWREATRVSRAGGGVASEREREAQAAFEAAQEEARAGFAAREAELEAARRELEAESADRAAREEERRRRLLGRYMQQMRQGSQASAFRAWRDHTSTRKSARRTLARLIGRRTHSELGRAMTSWREATRVSRAEAAASEREREAQAAFEAAQAAQAMTASEREREAQAAFEAAQEEARAGFAAREAELEAARRALEAESADRAAREEERRRRLLGRYMQQMRQGSQASAFRAWRDHTSTRKSARRTLARLIGRRTHSELGRAMTSWREATRQMRQGSQASAFRAWRDHTSTRKSARRTLARLIGRRTHSELGRAMTSWREATRVSRAEAAASEREREAQAAFEAAQAAQAMTASEREREAQAAFEAAQEEARAGFAAREAELEAARRALEAESADRAAREEERRRRLLGRYMQQMRQGSQASAFRAWRDHTSTRKSARRTLARLIGRRTHSELGRAMTSWREATRVSRAEAAASEREREAQAAFEAAQEEARAGFAAREAELEAARRALEAESADRAAREEERRRRLLGRYMQQMRQGSQASAFRAWRDHTSTRKSARRTLARLIGRRTHSELGRAMTSWREATRVSRAEAAASEREREAQAAFEAAQEEARAGFAAREAELEAARRALEAESADRAAREEERRRRLLGRYMQQMRQGSQASAFRAWRDHTSTRKSARRTLARLIGRRTHSELGRAMTSWREATRVSRAEAAASEREREAQAAFEAAQAAQAMTASEREREAQAAFEAAQEEARAGFAAREAELEAARRALEAESADRAAREEERRRRLLGRYMQQMRQGSQASAFRAWRDHTSTRKSARRTLARLIGRRTHSELGRAMTSWREATRVSRAEAAASEREREAQAAFEAAQAAQAMTASEREREAQAAFEAAQEEARAGFAAREAELEAARRALEAESADRAAREEERRRRLLGRYMQQMRQGSQASAFRAWRDHTSTRKSARRTLARLIGRRTHSELGRAMTSWREATRVSRAEAAASEREREAQAAFEAAQAAQAMTASEPQAASEAALLQAQKERDEFRHRLEELESGRAALESSASDHRKRAESARQHAERMHEQLAKATSVGEEAVKQAEVYKLGAKKLAERLEQVEAAARHVTAAQEAARASQKALAAERAASIAAADAAARAQRQAAALQEELARLRPVVEEAALAKSDIERLRSRNAKLRKALGLQERAAAFSARQEGDIFRAATERALATEEGELHEALDAARTAVDQSFGKASGDVSPRAAVLARLVRAVEAERERAAEEVLHSERCGGSLSAKSEFDVHVSPDVAGQWSSAFRSGVTNGIRRSPRGARDQ
ncbi:hypothetical protein FNF27_00632 [Cafeteria roenbergensis]|uniref:Uncharacterized protein n=3 Tax=Cafeteria roenbergensis TaxID=33653 RepID=A0A5A8EL84_CAFRO|nr:hypothetical protein FNF27_00632 [Cafeteria roenbergensis]